ncbi:MAG: hypothetical protein ACHQNT_02295 [Bacteroidia bacterium]
MKKPIKLMTTMILMGITVFIACTKENLTTPSTGGSTGSAPISDNDRTACGKIIQKKFFNKNKVEVGVVTVWNDENLLYVEYNTFNGYLIDKGNLYVGECEDLAQMMTEGNIDPSLFPYETWDNVNGNHFVFTIDFAKKKLDCVCIAAQAIVVDALGNQLDVWAEGNQFTGEKFGMYFEYCIQVCCNGNRTQTQGGWGAVPQGGNPGTYLHAKFAGAFPGGLIVGCNKKITLTSAQAVTNFLPQGSTPKVLTQNYLNPTNDKITVLAGQVVALKLNITFDAYDVNFDANNVLLGNMVIASGPFVNWTVAQLLAEAEKKLGGCASPYTLSQLNDAADKINKNYDNGVADLGYLNCPAQ